MSGHGARIAHSYHYIQLLLKLMEDLPLAEIGLFHAQLISGEIWEWYLKPSDSESARFVALLTYIVHAFEI